MAGGIKLYPADGLASDTYYGVVKEGGWQDQTIKPVTARYTLSGRLDRTVGLPSAVGDPRVWQYRLFVDEDELAALEALYEREPPDDLLVLIDLDGGTPLVYFDGMSAAENQSPMLTGTGLAYFLVDITLRRAN